jgi:hypothetical protein
MTPGCGLVSRAAALIAGSSRRCGRSSPGNPLGFQHDC